MSFYITSTPDMALYVIDAPSAQAAYKKAESVLGEIVGLEPVEEKDMCEVYEDEFSEARVTGLPVKLQEDT